MGTGQGMEEGPAKAKCVKSVYCDWIPEGGDRPREINILILR